MPEPSPANPPQPATPATPDPEKVKLVADAEDARRRASIAEQQAAYSRGALESMRRAPEPQRPAVVDPLDRYSKEDLTLAPDDKRAMLDQAIRMRAEEMTRRSSAQLEQRLQAERVANESARALEMVQWSRPELQRPENAPNFGAAITKAKMEASMQGVELSPTQLAQRAAVIYDQTFKPQSERPPFIEGANRGTVEQPPRVQEDGTVSFLEKKYGMKKGKVQPMFDAEDPNQIDQLNLDYLKGRNEPLIKKGINSSMQEVWAAKDGYDKLGNG